MKADSETIVITNSSSPLVPLTLVDPNLTNTEDATTILHSTKDTLKIELSARYDELKLSMLGKLLEQNQNISSLSIRKQKEEIIDSKYLTTLRNILINSGIFKKSLQQNSKHLDFSITTLNYHLTVIRDGNELKANITYTKQFVVSMNSEDEKLKKESAQLQKTFMEEHLRLTALESNPLQQDPKEVCKELELKNKKHICQPNYLKKILKKRSIATYIPIAFHF